MSTLLSRMGAILFSRRRWDLAATLAVVGGWLFLIGRGGWLLALALWAATLARMIAEAAGVSRPRDPLLLWLICALAGLVRAFAFVAGPVVAFFLTFAAAMGDQPVGDDFNAFVLGLAATAITLLNLLPLAVLHLLRRTLGEALGVAPPARVFTPARGMFGALLAWLGSLPAAVLFPHPLAMAAPIAGEVLAIVWLAACAAPQRD